jgi:predicted DNA-binding transcriptional regulator YafY
MMSVQVGKIDGGDTRGRVDGHRESAYRFSVGTKRAKQAGRAKRAEQGKMDASYENRPADERILSLLMLLLDEQRPVSRTEIFQLIPGYRNAGPEAAERKFERDKEELRALGVPLVQEQERVDGKEESVYQVSQRSYGMRPVRLDDEERIALILAAEALRGSEGLVYRELVDDALRKLTFDSGKPRLPAQLAISLPTRDEGKRMRKNLEVIGDAVQARKSLTLTYESGGRTTVRKVDPYAAMYVGGNWQLVGHCHLRGQPRTFRVDRIRTLKMAPRPGTPDFERPAGFNPHTYVQRSPWVFQAGESDLAMDVVLDIGPERAWMVDEDFGPGATREALGADVAGGEGWTRVRFRSGNPGYIVTRALDAAGHLRVVAPVELRARVGEIAGRIAAANSDGADGGAR